MIRTFVALDLPPAVKGQLEKLIDELRHSRPAVTWVKADRLHLTIKFLGNVPAEKIAEITTALQGAASRSAPFRLQPSGCEAFPSLKQMRVIWVGLKGDREQLSALRTDVEAALAPLGFPPEGRPFRAHLTIGRVKGPRELNSLQQALQAQRHFQVEAFDVTELVLYKSDLRSEGPLYTPLFRAILSG